MLGSHQFSFGFLFLPVPDKGLWLPVAQFFHGPDVTSDTQPQVLNTDGNIKQWPQLVAWSTIQIHRQHQSLETDFAFLAMELHQLLLCFIQLLFQHLQFLRPYDGRLTSDTATTDMIYITTGTCKRARNMITPTVHCRRYTEQQTLIWSLYRLEWCSIIRNKCILILSKCNAQKQQQWYDMQTQHQVAAWDLHSRLEDVQLLNLPCDSRPCKSQSSLAASHLQHNDNRKGGTAGNQHRTKRFWMVYYTMCR